MGFYGTVERLLNRSTHFWGFERLTLCAWSTSPQAKIKRQRRHRARARAILDKTDGQDIWQEHAPRRERPAYPEGRLHHA
jgi:hypothetical protein